MLKRNLAWLLTLVTVMTVVATVAPAFGQREVSTLEKVTKKGELRVGWSPWFPFLYVDPKTQKLTGFTVDLYEHMGKVLGVKIVWVEHPWSVAMAGLQADKFDVVSNAYRTPKRLLVAEYAGPMTRTGKALGSTKAKVGQWKSWQDADNPNTKLCVPLGTAADTDVTKAFTKANVMRPEGDPACIQALAAGRADVYAADIGILIALIKEHPDFAVVPNSVFAKSELGIWVKQGDQVMLNWVNMFIRDAKLEGVIERLIKKYNLQDGYEVAW